MWEKRIVDLPFGEKYTESRGIFSSVKCFLLFVLLIRILGGSLHCFRMYALLIS